MNEKKIGFGLISLILGLVAVVMSPTVFVFIAPNVVVFCATTIISIVTALIAFVLGIVAVTRKDLLGWVGTILAIVAGVMMLLPILFVMGTGLI